VQNGSYIEQNVFPSPLTDDVIINVLHHHVFFLEILKGRASPWDSDNADLGFSYSQIRIFLFNPTTPIKGILSVSNIICFEWIIKKK
jgi:hypothetical protein